MSSQPMIRIAGAALLACALLLATGANALRDDRIYKVAMICEYDCTELPELDALRDQLESLLPPGPSAIWPMSASELATAPFDELPQYSFVVWHHRGSEGASAAVLDQASRRVLAAEVPALVFDDQGFPISNALGLTTAVAGGQVDAPLCAHGDQIDRGVFHHLLTSQVELDSDQVRFDRALEGPATRANYVDRAAVDLEAFTRPVVFLGGPPELGQCDPDGEDPSKVLAIVNDRRRIAASGVYEHGAYEVPFLLHQMLDYATAVGPEAAMANWIDQPALDNEDESALFSPGGQAVLTETDWTQTSRGFDFVIKRTYRSGVGDVYSYLGSNWYHNHDRYLVHDTFNHQLHVHDGTGGVTVMSRVQAHTGTGAGRDTYVAVGSGVTDIATYYDYTEEHELTRANPFFGTYDPDDPEGNLEACIGADHSDDVILEQWSSGFAVRDPAGNIAFYAYHPIDDDDPDSTAYGDQRLRTKGGGLVHYRLAYLMDRNGNRQDYYYAHTDPAAPGNGDHDTPERLLWCVVDTEDRGYFFEMEWAQTQMDGHIVGSQGPRLPWLRQVYLFDDWDGGTASPSLLYSYLDDGSGCEVDATFHGLLLDQVSLWRGGADETVYKLYGYDFSAYEDPEQIGCSASGWGNHFVPLAEATDWIASSSAPPIVSFAYDPPAADTCNAGLDDDNPCGLEYPRFYQGALRRHVAGADSAGFPAEVATEVEYSYGVRPGTPDRHDLEEPFGWVSMMNNGVGQTLVFNGLYHIVEKRLWYTADRCPEGDDSAGAVDCTDVDLGEDPGACADWDTSWPEIPCEGQSWSWSFRTNHDGQVVWSRTPVWETNKWIETEVKHVFEWAVEHELGGIAVDEPVADQLLAFWQDLWPQRHWMANPVLTTTRGWEGQQIDTLTTYDPLFNQPLLVEREGVLQRRLNYDYLAFAAGPLSDAELFGLMRIPHALGEGWHLSSCPYGDCRLNMLDPAAMPFGECGAPVAPGPTQDPQEGNLVCEEVIDTQSYGLSVGRDPAAAAFQYDQHGRMTRTDGLDGRVVLEQYVSYAPYSLVKTVSRVGTGSSPAIQTRYYYDERGQNVRKMLAVDGPLDEPGTRCVQERYAYDGLGRLIHARVLEDGDCATDGGEIAVREEIYEHDAAGNVVASRTVRCPDEESCAAGATEVGEYLDRVKLYDSKHRNTWDCREIDHGGDPPVTAYSCTVRGYGADDRLALEGRLDRCEVDDAADLESELLGCADDWLDLRYVAEHGYDERRLRHRTRLFDPSGLAPDRITRVYRDADGRVVAAHDAADSDCSGPDCDEPEWTRSEYDGLGRLRRRTAGLDGPDPLGTPGAVADSWAYDDFDNVLRQARGLPDSGGATDESLGRTDYLYDKRGSLIARFDRDYPVGGSPAEADVTATFFSYDQCDRPELEVRYNHDAGIEQASHSYYDAYGRLQLVDQDSAGADVADVYYERDHLGRVLEERRLSHSQLSFVGDLETATAFGYDAAGQPVYRAELDTADDPQPPHETFDRYDGLGYLVETVDPQGQPTVHYRDGLGHTTRLVELLPAGSWYFTEGFGSDPAIYDELQVVTEYDGLGQVIRRTDHKGNYTAYERNAFGEIIAVDMPGSTAEGEFDNRFHKRFELNGDGAITSIAHYLNYGSPEDEPLRELALELDRQNRPRVVRNSAAEGLQTFYYDGNGNLTLAFDHNDAVDEVAYVRTDRQWTTAGHLLADRTEISTASGVEAWEATATYAGGRLAHLHTPSGADVAHQYWTKSPLTRRVTVTGLGGGTTPAGYYYWIGRRPLRRYQFFGPGQYVRTRLDWGGEPAYDGFGRPVRTDVRQHAGIYGTIARFDLGYDANDRLVSEDRIKGPVGRDIEYGLDDLDRVETYQAGEAADHYYLDQADNVRQAETWAHGQVEMEIDHGIVDDGDPGTFGLNQVTAMRYLEYGSFERTFEYDPGGNMTFDLGPPEQGGRAFSWDDHGRLVRVEQAAGGESVYAYDALGRRVRKLVRRDERRTDRFDYRMFGDDVVEEYQNKAWKEQDLWLIVRDPTAVDRYLRWDHYRWEGSAWELEERYVPVTDARNNVLAVRSLTGSVELEYNLYGEELDPDHGQHVPYRFAGRRYDEDTGLYYYRTRYYAPDLGRFLSVDSIGIWGDLNNYGNGYAYVGNMSNALLDPTGQIESGPGFKPLPGSEPHPERIDVRRDFNALWVWLDKAVTTALDAVTFGEASRQKAIELGHEKQQLKDKVENLEKEIKGLKEQLQRSKAKQEENEEQQQQNAAQQKQLADFFEALCGSRSGCEKDENGNWVPKSGGSGGMPAEDSDGILTKEDVYYLSATGQLGTEPKRPDDPIEYQYDRPGSDYWAFKNRKKEKKKLPVSDDGNTYLQEMIVAPYTDWEKKLSIHNPGTIDPM